MQHDFTRDKEGLMEWHKITEKIKIEGKYKPYDCIVGVNGGTIAPISYICKTRKSLDYWPFI